MFYWYLLSYSELTFESSFHEVFKIEQLINLSNVSLILLAFHSTMAKVIPTAKALVRLFATEHNSNSIICLK